MRVTRTKIPDVLIIEPTVFRDARGFFFESFNQKAFNEAVGGKYASFRTTIQKASNMCCAAYTISFPQRPKGNLSVCFKAKYLTLL